MEEKEIKKSLIARIDEKAEEKGPVVKTIWQITKFTVISLFATLVQIALVNILYFCLKEWKAPLPSFLANIFSSETVGEGNDNWGYLLPFFVSNAVANTIGYFLNKSKTFKSDAPLWHFIIYIGILVALILFCTWLQGVLVNAMNETEIPFFISMGPTIASMTAGVLQACVLFPIQKFILLREKKEKTAK